MAQVIWQQCLACLQDELPSQQFNTWIRPLKVNESGRVIQLLAPNRFVQDWVRDKYFSRIRELVSDYASDTTQDVELVVDRVDKLNTHFTQARKDIEGITTAAERAGKRAHKLNNFDFEEIDAAEAVVPLTKP